MHELHPPYASWLNHVERRFGIITQRGIRRGSFYSVKELIAKDREVCGRLQQDQGTVQLDRYGGFNPGEAPATLPANLRDGTLENK